MTWPIGLWRIGTWRVGTWRGADRPTGGSGGSTVAQRLGWGIVKAPWQKGRVAAEAYFARQEQAPTPAMLERATRIAVAAEVRSVSRFAPNELERAAREALQAALGQWQAEWTAVVVRAVRRMRDEESAAALILIAAAQ